MNVYNFFDYCNIDKTTDDFIEGRISESEFFRYVNVDILNESVIEIGSYLREKVLDVLYTFIIKASKIGFKIIESFKKFFNVIFEKFSKWKEKHPVLYKIIIITIITVLLLIISASSAYAQKTGDPTPVNHINVAIGWLEMIKGKTNLDVLEVNKAIAHLIDLRDGNIEITQLNQEAIDIANSAIDTSSKMISDAKVNLDKGDEGMAKMCLNLMEKGAQYVQGIYSKSGDSEYVKLYTK
jgi:hypothetical protein